MTNKRPPLTNSIKPKLFADFYWLKSELINFCRQNKLSTLGSKQALAQRIEIYLTNGITQKPSAQKKSGARDSTKALSKNTLVINYKNDTATRNFFIQHIGPHFKFNDYLRQHTDQSNIKSGLTYGDLIIGWIKAESHRETKPIAKQFEYNRFIKDFFAHEKNKSLKDAIKAWNKIKAKPGSNQYIK